MRSLRSSLLAAFLVAVLSACQSSSPDASGAQTVNVAVEPPSAEVSARGTVRFAATVTGTADPAVVWEVVESGGGTVDADGLYAAPATPGVFHVRARSRAAPEVRGESVVTVTARPAPVVVTVTPSPVTADACATLTFSATVTGATDTSVTWSVQEGAAGGTITAAGVYTAPAAPGTYHVQATSRAEPSSSAVVPVAVAERVLSVAVSPAQVQLAPGESAQFTAMVTTTCGTFASTSTVTAPPALVAN